MDRRSEDEFRERVKFLQRENREHYISHDSIVDKFRSVSINMYDPLDGIQHLGGEIELRDQPLQQSYIELQQERDRSLTLQDKVTTIEQRIVVLEKNISTC
ncbi:hypothetical protein F4782DRAFT_482307 [Xylaria castorea]|nr:hypothetical protein F4782DRAFT_482307 [Xylaria castorea]